MFSNQNLENQTAASQENIKNLQQEYEETIGELEKGLKNVTTAKADSDSYIEELQEELKHLQNELNDLEERSGQLKTENERLSALMEQEGQYLVLQLTNGFEKLRILEITYKENTERLTFTDDEREKMKSNLENTILNYLANNERLSVLFLYDGDNSYSRDTSAIEAALEKLQKEQYFVYTKMNLSR